MFVVDQLKRDLASSHLWQQAARVTRLFIFAFASQLAALGTSHLDRKALLSLLVGAAEAAYRQAAPVVPWTQLAQRLHLLGLVQPAAAPSVAAPAAVVTPPVPPVAADGAVPPAGQ